MWYLIKSGTFREVDNSIKGPGDLIELGDDVAARHPGQLEAHDSPPSPPPPASAPAQP